MPIFHSDVKLTRGYNLPHIFAAQCASQTASFPDRTFHAVCRRCRAGEQAMWPCVTHKAPGVFPSK